VDAYLAALPEVQRAPLEALRATIRAEAPEATEGIAYQMPAFYASGRLLVSYAAFKSHLSLFPASGAVIDGLGDELRRYLSGKGTIRFTPDDALSDDLVRQIVRIRREELAGTADRTA
jgi:uncharacterized protein YdhG (YjbR/CyaY superfamily)